MKPTPLPAHHTLLDADPWLKPHANALKARQMYFESISASLAPWGGTDGLSRSHHYFGFHRGVQAGKAGVWFREWAPGAQSLWLIGDFNDWDREAHPLNRDTPPVSLDAATLRHAATHTLPGTGVWSRFFPDEQFGARLTHGSRIKVCVQSAALGKVDRLPTYVRRAVQEANGDFNGQYWAPPAYEFRHPTPSRQQGLKIYEAHVGMATEEGKVGSFAEFTRDVVPRVARLGYNAIQLMAVMEHPYYASFGYHVSNFYAVSSRFGTPEELKALIDAAHGQGLQVFLDLVHSHAAKNVNEGLNLFDGSDHQFFHAGARGLHPAWDSLVFDYAKPEVLRFLLSNVRFWLEEFRFDGFRFDGVTSMLYVDHGLHRVFTSYNDYFGPGVDEDALVYLKLANQVAHSVRDASASITTIAEDVSGMVGTARPVAEGGLGFDYRLAMGAPDFWIKTLKEKADEQWSLTEIYNVLLNRRRDEKHVAYAESHDQALVGDLTLAFRLMDQEMYWKMAKGTPSAIIDRGLALHKLIRLVTFSLAGEAWLSFMGNEFGHPEWIDFPRAGNEDSFQYARRQWSLAERKDLRYQGLERFDRAMLALDREFGVLEQPEIRQLALHEDHKQLVYQRGSLIFAFNFHPTQSFPDLRIPLPEARDYRVVLDSDDLGFEGLGRMASSLVYPWQPVALYGHSQSLQLYLPNRSVQVLAPAAAQV